MRLINTKRLCYKCYIFISHFNSNLILSCDHVLKAERFKGYSDPVPSLNVIQGSYPVAVRKL